MSAHMDAQRFTVAELQPAWLSPAQLAQIDAIFFQASGRIFTSDAERAVFRERWLGRYLAASGDVLVVAMDGQENIVGYLVGALEDPAEQARFADISCLQGAFRDLCRIYPAHLHINLSAAVRGLGLGGRLVEAFAGRARRQGAPGLHAVTGSQSRNVSFYERCGFARLRSTPWNGHEVVFLGRRLTSVL